MLIILLLLELFTGNSSSTLSHGAVVVAIFFSVIAFIIVSVVFIILGFACGYYCQRRNKHTSSETRTVTSTPEFRITESDKDLELKGNVAYCTVHPISHAQ